MVVAQSGNTLHVWYAYYINSLEGIFRNFLSCHLFRYNPSIPEQVTTVAIKGEVEAVLRDAERTEVIVQVGFHDGLCM